VLEECPAAKDEHILCWCGGMPCAVRLDGSGFHTRYSRIHNPAEFADTLQVEETALLLGDYATAVAMERLGELPGPWREFTDALKRALGGEDKHMREKARG